MKTNNSIASSELLFTMDEFKSGGDKMLALLHHQFTTILQSFTFRIVKETAAASDLASESILSLWGIRNNIESHVHLRRSLLKIAYNKSLDYKKSTFRRIEREMNYSTSFDNYEQGPLETMIKEEAYNDLLLKLERLPVAWRNVIRMAYIDGMKNQEIADKLNISLNTVKFYKYHGLKDLRTLYGLNPTILYPIFFIKQIVRFIFSFL